MFPSGLNTHRVLAWLHQPALVILAVHLSVYLPGRALRTSNTPVIILSGSIDSQGQERVKLLGAEAVLSKPLVPAELLEALTKAL